MMNATAVGRAVLITATLAGFLLIPSTVAANDGCRHRIERAEARLDRAIRDHGYDSHQARERREQLRDARESCHADRW